MKEIILFNVRFRPTKIRNYWVSEYGDIVNMDNKPYKKMKQMVTNDGHNRIDLKIAPNKPKKFYVHQLVYKAFVGEINDGMVIEHLDSNGLNNYYKNLKQSTQKENIKTAIDVGNFGENAKKKFVILDTITNKILEFDKIKDGASYIGLKNVDSISRFFRKKSTRERYKLICSGYLVCDRAYHLGAE